MLIRYPRTVMVSKENYYREYKGHTNWLSLISSQFPNNIHFVMHMLIIPVLYVYRGDSHKRTVQVCAARKPPIFRPWPLLMTTFSTWAAPKDPLFKKYTIFCSDLARSKIPLLKNWPLALIFYYNCLSSVYQCVCQIL